MTSAKYLLGAFTLAFFVAGLVSGLMPVSTDTYDCGAPLRANHARWQAEDAVDRIVDGPADRDAACSNRISGPRTIALALFAAAGALIVGQVVMERAAQREATSEEAAP